MSTGIEIWGFFFCCSPSRQQKQISGSHILTKCVSQKPERSFVCSELAISKQLASKSHGLACLRKCTIHTFHTSHSSVLDAFTPMGFFILDESSASAEHLSASWMVLGALWQDYPESVRFWTMFISSQKYSEFLWPVEFNPSISLKF